VRRPKHPTSSGDGEAWAATEGSVNSRIEGDAAFLAGLNHDCPLFTAPARYVYPASIVLFRTCLHICRYFYRATR
jgi:hypothetical protein